jgi:hypothetical protein
VGDGKKELVEIQVCAMLGSDVTMLGIACPRVLLVLLIFLYRVIIKEPIYAFLLQSPNNEAREFQLLPQDWKMV